MTTLASLSQQTTAVMILDYQQLLVGSMVRDPAAHLDKVADFLGAARDCGMPVIYITVGFRPGYPEVSDNNLMFAGVRKGERFQLGAENSAIPAAIAPQPYDLVVVKHRVSAFAGTETDMLLRARRIDTLVLFGIATSGVVLSTVRQAADLDYKIVVVGDLCVDADATVNALLLENILPRQATVLDSASLLG